MTWHDYWTIAISERTRYRRRVGSRVVLNWRAIRWRRAFDRAMERTK